MPAAPTPPDATQLVEIELKLQVDPKDIDRLKQSPLLAGVDCLNESIDNIYFDTVDRLLHRNRMALRLRHINGRWLQTLKTADGSGGSLSQRGEWETPARVMRGQGRVDWMRFGETPLSKLFAARKTPPALRALFHTRFERTKWILQRSGATIEVALDIGEITQAGDTRPDLREPICEVELELKQGEPIVLLDTALELLGSSRAAPLALIPMTRSKAERGYQLLTNRAPPAVKASAKGFVRHVQRKSTTARALRHLVAHGLAVVTANAEMLQNKDDAEYVHQARVALRRVRSAIRLLDREQSDVPQPLRDELQWLARALGDARDWDVITGETLPSLTEAIGADAVKALGAKAEIKRVRAHVNVRTSTQSARYAALVLSGERWSMTPAPTGAPLLVDAAPSALKRASKKLFQSACFFAALSVPKRHQVRIHAKRLRYALDLFAVALPTQVTERYIEALADLQDVLGEMNDAAVVRAELPQLTKSAVIKKAVEKWSSSRELDDVRDIERRLLALSKLRTPWS